MKLRRALLATICAAITAGLASPTRHPTGPIVTLDGGTFTGTTANGTNRFLGIPFARPPSVVSICSPPCPPWLIGQSGRVGDLRFRLPQPPIPYSGTHNATVFGLSCPQQVSNQSLPNGLPQATIEYLGLLSDHGTTIIDGEDCADEESPHHTESNSDNSCRLDSQCRCTISYHTWFRPPGCSGMYSMDGILSFVLIISTRLVVDIWR